MKAMYLLLCLLVPFFTGCSNDNNDKPENVAPIELKGSSWQATIKRKDSADYLTMHFLKDGSVLQSGWGKTKDGSVYVIDYIPTVYTYEHPYIYISTNPSLFDDSAPGEVLTKLVLISSTKMKPAEGPEEPVWFKD